MHAVKHQQQLSVVRVVAGRNPLEYSASSPYTVFLFQSVLIMILCHFLHWPLSKLKQPRVIAEVITGIVLGPTVMGRVPGFTANCFPTSSISGLTIVANIGIIFFLFIVGLEVDLRYIRRNARVALTVGFVNMAVPFSLGCGIARGLYNEYQVDSQLTLVLFTTYMVFVAVALCFTAFPVLARILVELNLIGDHVGTIVLSAGIFNDLVGWILLALVVTLANSANSIHTLYILLLALAWFLIMMFPVKRVLCWYLRCHTNDLITGQPSQSLMGLIIAIVFISAFYTDAIGVHPIFGAFMVGVLISRDNGYGIRITEKLEDMVHLVMIPIYFAVAGLNVDLSELNRGTDWAYVVVVVVLAMAGKIFGGFVAAKLNGLVWRESLAVGVLMSCKGIVEIVVLNVGLNAGIISTRVYSIFILMALVTTFCTTPLTLWVYPAQHRHSVSKQLVIPEGKQEQQALMAEKSTCLSLDTLEMFSFPSVHLLLHKTSGVSDLLMLLKDLQESNSFRKATAIYLREFTSRTSHLLEASAAGEPENTNEQDSEDSKAILAIIEAFGSLLKTRLHTMSLLAPMENYMASINNHLAGPASLVVSCITFPSMAQSDAESLEAMAIYNRLIDTCLGHVGILLTSGNYTIKSQRSILLILDHDDRLTGLDLLSLHMMHQLTRKGSINHVYIRSSTGFDDQFMQQFDAYLKRGAEDAKLEIAYFQNIDEIFVKEDMEKNRAVKSFAMRDKLDVLVIRAAQARLE
ncbi:hypothetical protein METBIDRAFT_78789 [Metschnikowia bicuspidata var. bicuspidata NRRL YB-4993]|uniref:Cation/H+ exchanger transmembrane domain-containing protein n=1 Tax=Metschnikowia bicuspidata var. bicuspidata NRRL YB-4993 TaxID=869754 RepID=A0A1A0H8F4_9ASCO|nr:hypothetical protein METBIDRAFT_78789 [Metschnikowia bicuspidata var. bicuspidata NRRL YB-4993]OBA20394.1 hypothetical protein METBIDRAFT_78789 [Metschnikowia bicuspidata var. bicuspidata NRRL YB-4993]